MSDHNHYGEYADARHDHEGDYAAARHDHDLEHARKHHDHHEITGLREDLARAGERIRELEDGLRGALERIRALEGRHLQALAGVADRPEHHVDHVRGGAVTGPEHYREAEGDLERAARAGDYGSDTERYFLARAQVHAMLALAATVLPSAPGMPVRDCDAWEAAVATPAQQEAREAQDDDEPEPEEYDPGPEADDEGGMSEYRYALPEDYERGQS